MVVARSYRRNLAARIVFMKTLVVITSRCAGRSRSGDAVVSSANCRAGAGTHTMRRHSLVLAGFLVVTAGLVGVAGRQSAPAGQGAQAAQASEFVGKKICGYPRPEGVPVEVWENACEACTSVPVAPEASTDGTLTSHSCDGGYEIRIKVVPGKTHAAGAMRDIMKGGGLGEEKPPNQQERKVGEMPQVAQTFTRYDASYPFMNEKGVIIGETTIGGRRELYNDEGLMDIMELERIALERASTAREADQDHGRNGREVRLRRQRRVPHGRRRQGSVAVRDLRRRAREGGRRLGRQAHPARRGRRVGESVAHHHARQQPRLLDVLDEPPGGRRIARPVEEGRPVRVQPGLRDVGRADPEPPRVARAQHPGPVAQPRPVGRRTAVLGEARQEGQRPAGHGDPPRHLRGHAVPADRQPARGAVRHAEPLVAAARLQARPTATRPPSA